MRRLVLAGLIGVALLVAAAGGAAALILYGGGEQPISYVVVRGDTLFEIATAHGVTVEQLREWNGLDGDLIEVDQVLLVWPADGTAEAPAPARSGRPRPSAAPSSGTADAPRLELPPEKPCLAGPSLDGAGDRAMAASAGLSQEQVSGAMSGFVHHTLRCLADLDAYPTVALDLEITVACTGRVAEVAVVDRGDWSSDTARCVTDTLRYAPFPAHDLPDGETFRYPLRFRPD